MTQIILDSRLLLYTLDAEEACAQNVIRFILMLLSDFIVINTISLYCMPLYLILLYICLIFLLS